MKNITLSDLKQAVGEKKAAELDSAFPEGHELRQLIFDTWTRDHSAYAEELAEERMDIFSQPE